MFLKKATVEILLRKKNPRNSQDTSLKTLLHRQKVVRKIKRDPGLDARTRRDLNNFKVEAGRKSREPLKSSRRRGRNKRSRTRKSKGKKGKERSSGPRRKSNQRAPGRGQTISRKKQKTRMRKYIG